MILNENSELRHKNIILFKGACTSAQNPCIVMEYADGGSLSSKIKDKSFQISPELIVNWAKQIASGMEYLHFGSRKQIIHRDLKSGNILVFFFKKK